ncbi:hypothetical protein [Micromonospora sp. A202]|uniref:hypothetical protein n=1 Tax=Micromonospora sp. A202 TaxID=2572899 RepID=UPI001151740A|nr:hypothetical protein [Micromonospora sp. A202]
MYTTTVEWSRIVLALLLPIGLWLLTLALLAGQILYLLFFETRIASGIIERRTSDHLTATLGIAVLYYYDISIFIPVMTGIYPKGAQIGARYTFIIVLAGISLLSAATAFHYSISPITKFKGRSLLVFPPAIYDKDPISVRGAWIKIFNLIGLTSMVVVAMIHVWVYFIACILPKRDPALTLPFIAGLGVVVFLTGPLRNLILRYPSSLVATSKINQVVAQSAKAPEVRRSLSRRKSDPISWARGELLQIARILERMARQEDSQFGVNTNHPVAAIYRAVADHIRIYCNSAKSLESSVPSSMILTLKATEGLMITGDSASRKQLIRRLNVFEADGTPRALVTAPTSGSAARTVRTAARYADLSLVWLQSRWQAIAIALAVVAFLLGQLDLKSLLAVAQ